LLYCVYFRTSLYPDVFSRSHPFDSFDINDLNTVDDAVRELLREELRSPQVSDFVIAHVIGVDHCGHKYGPDHYQMASTLRKIDDIIVETANVLSTGDLLIVLGDHGMTTSGDHGGDSDDETQAGLLFYWVFVLFCNYSITLRDRQRAVIVALPNGLHQIDLVPTLSLLLGLPIPFLQSRSRD
ncbi:hypothetical protein COOONC_28393, partial [Cooperia oncophora]